MPPARNTSLRGADECGNVPAKTAIVTLHSWTLVSFVELFCGLMSWRLTRACEWITVMRKGKTSTESHNYSLRQCLELCACTDCRACLDVCPAARTAGDGRLSPQHRIRGVWRILKSRMGGLLSRVLGTKALTEDEWTRFSDQVFRCTLCGNCQQVCPVGIRLKPLWLNLRNDLVSSGHYPEKIDIIKENLEHSHNVFDEENDERADWVEDLEDPPEDLYVRDNADVVYFTGCTAAFYPAAQEIPVAFSEILSQARVDFTLLGEEEWCCGFPLLGAGLKDMVPHFMEHNIQAVKEKGARQVVFACPSCYQMWKDWYPYKQHGIEIFHSTAFVLDLIRKSRLQLKPLDMVVTYHDPCDLGRGAGEFDAPREIIQSLPGVRLVELPRNRENCACCGGGGNLEMIDPELAAGIAKAKIEEAVSTGAQCIVTSCQQCVRTMLTFVRRNKVSIRVLDITQLVSQALQDGDQE